MVTAERERVVKVAVARRDAFARTFTLPELIRWAGVVRPRRSKPWSDWLDEIDSERPRAQRTGLLVLVVGLMLGIGAAFLIDFIDDDRCAPTCSSSDSTPH